MGFDKHFLSFGCQMQIIREKGRLCTSVNADAFLRSCLCRQIWQFLGNSDVHRASIIGKLLSACTQELLHAGIFILHWIRKEKAHFIRLWPAILYFKTKIKSSKYLIVKMPASIFWRDEHKFLISLHTHENRIILIFLLGRWGGEGQAGY